MQFIVTNQASRNETLKIIRRGTHMPVADSGPINPGGVQNLQVNFRSGEYLVATESSRLTALGAKAIPPATLHIGPSRPSASNALLQP